MEQNGEIKVKDEVKEELFGESWQGRRDTIWYDDYVCFSRYYRYHCLFIRCLLRSTRFSVRGSSWRSISLKLLKLVVQRQRSQKERCCWRCQPQIHFLNYVHPSRFQASFFWWAKIKKKKHTSEILVSSIFGWMTLVSDTIEAEFGFSLSL